MANTDEATGILQGEVLTDKNKHEHYVLCFRFRYVTSDSVDVQFSIDPTPAEPIEWSALVDAIKTDQQFGISMCSEADVSVDYAGGQVKIYIQSTGCDGNLDMTLPAAKCVAAFEKCAAAYAAHNPSLGASS
ncbi:hypothetical protein pclt_cds_793 [Pandoravirus celtis]|uniref:Uncharacterized protein n=1 Tax=Pandoravirus celtis TaxID=2568002 RepID=A0A4D6EHU2_9VIRU|nr:hypothetical protein pclt_cds_793 [Pandoravirus celtis]